MAESEKQIDNVKYQVRAIESEDIPKILQLEKKIYSDMLGSSEQELKERIRHFPEGHFVAVCGKKIVGYCSSLRISGKLALNPHTWAQVTGQGTAKTDDPKGDYLYGFEMFVDPKHQRHHIGHRFHNERKKLCDRLNLKGIVICCRMEHLAKKIKQVKTPEKYLEMVVTGKVHDPTIAFELHNGFEILGVLKDYLPEDKKSLGFALQLVWHNPHWSQIPSKTNQNKHQVAQRFVASGYIRVATVQYEQRKISSFQEFQKIVEYFISSLAEYHTDFVVFPELFTMQLLTINNKPLSAHKAIMALAAYLDDFKEMMQKLACRYHVNIIAGSHPTQSKAGIENVAYIFLRDGSVHAQGKIHPTPNERKVWGMKGTNELNAIMTDCGPIGVLICYDTEFPELARHLIDQDIYVLFIPFCTDERRGYLRVRYCAQARCVENQCFAVMSGNVGNLPGIHNMNLQYAQSCILTPSDFPFSRDGIASETTPNVEAIALADLSITALLSARQGGTVRNIRDRRHDLYSITWNSHSKN